jgi:hypothetical protein
MTACAYALVAASAVVTFEPPPDFVSRESNTDLKARALSVEQYSPEDDMQYVLGGWFHLLLLLYPRVKTLSS